MWNEFPRKKPKKNGWYQCTVEVPGQQRYVMDLYWYGETGRFIDNRRQNVFDTYKVYGCDGKQLTTIPLCDRTTRVKAWCNMPDVYMIGFIKEEDIYD